MLSVINSRAAALLTALGLALLSATVSADEDCSKAVNDAFSNQRGVEKLRMKTTMINQEGLIKMTVDYQLPSRMRQLVTRLGDPAPRETVLVDEKAWTRQGGGWTEVPKTYTEQLVKQVYDTVIDPPKDASFYACAGKDTLDGRAVMKYRGYETIKTPDEKTNEVRSKVVKRDDAPIRLVYVDAETGLPVRNTVATANKPDRPFFKAVFSYPDDLKIDAPQ